MIYNYKYPHGEDGNYKEKFFRHDKTFTKEEFEEMVKTIIKQEEDKSFIFDKIENRLVEEFGFKILEIY